MGIQKRRHYGNPGRKKSEKTAETSSEGIMDKNFPNCEYLDRKIQVKRTVR